MEVDIPIVMLSGMAADERLFEPQLNRFPELRVQPWIEPQPGESIPAYAARLARLVDPGRPCLIGGASFGGIIALEMSAHLNTLGCVLIGSIRSPVELPWKWRITWPLAALGTDRLATLAGLAARIGRGVMSAGTQRRLRRLAQPDAKFVRWAMIAVTQWRPSPAISRVRVFQIHGAADHTLPVSLTHPDVIVPSGGHALTLFCPIAVNEFLEEVLSTLTDQQKPGIPE